MSGDNCNETSFAEEQGANYYMDLQPFQEKNTATVVPDVGALVKDDSLKGMKRCLIVMAFSLVVVALVTFAACTLAVFSYFHSPSGELQVNSLGGQIEQLWNKTKGIDAIISNVDELRNKTKGIDDIISNVNQLRNTTKEIDDIISSVDQLRNKTKGIDAIISSVDQLRNTTKEIDDIILNLDQLGDTTKGINDIISTLQLHFYCGAGQWNRIAYLNVSDPSQQCPSDWREVTTNGVRACGRLAASTASCPGTFYSASSMYQRVCGRVIGYQENSPDGFNTPRTINDAYIDGVSITYGQPRNHIWSYVAGMTERSSIHTISNCPCSTVAGIGAQSFVGDNYYCESGNPTDTYRSFRIADKLWDGKQCEGTCCTDPKSPPWFSVHLPNLTTENIEVRICGDEASENEDTPIELLEIYVQ